MGRADRLAIPRGADAAQLTRFLHRAHDHFVFTGEADPGVRPVVRDSWRRSVGAGLDPESVTAPVNVDEAQLTAIRAAHPLAAAMPVIRRLLVDSAADAGLLVAVSDAAGQLLWVEGCPRLRSRAESMHFMPGADWSERSAGTNAPGTALALDAGVQIVGPEHLARQVTPWSCSAAPIHEPDTGAMLGVLDITGGPDSATPQTLTLVRATVAAVEAELRLARLVQHRPDAPAGFDAPRLAVLGSRRARLSYGSTTTELGLRHSEILLLLSEAPEGLTASQLAVALSQDEHSSVTIRAEMSRLRSLLGPATIGSRPYRWQDGLRTDFHAVRSDLQHGRLRQAVARYRGPVLPASTAPGVVELREDLHHALRARLLASWDADTLLGFADTAHGRDDYEVWGRRPRRPPTRLTPLCRGGPAPAPPRPVPALTSRFAASDRSGAGAPGAPGLVGIAGKPAKPALCPRNIGRKCVIAGQSGARYRRTSGPHPWRPDPGEQGGTCNPCATSPGLPWSAYGRTPAARSANDRWPDKGVCRTHDRVRHPWN